MLELLAQVGLDNPAVRARLLVMKQGEQVEQGPPAQIVQVPQHPYTRPLLNAAPAFSACRQPRQLAPGAKPILSLQGVGKTFELPKVKGQDNRFVALQGLDLQVHPGQTLAIVGESGSGKSTALRIALGLEAPSQGHVLFDQQDVTGHG
ncbi:MAG: ATP-binding cassette domain-containing protein, partial [Pseudomonas sp.]